MNYRLGVPALTIAACVGCVGTVGQKIDPSVVGGFKEGVTTRGQVEAALGQSKHVTSMSDAKGITTTIYYVFAQAVGFGGAESECWAFSFGPDGVLERKINTQSQH